MTDRSILLVVHAGREDARRVAKDFSADLCAAGVTVRLVESDARDLDIPDAVVVPDGHQAAEGCELAVVLGGDGTILRAAELCHRAGTPVLGVNLGHVGFLAEADVEEVHAVTQRVIARDYDVEERLTVQAEVQVDGRVVARNWALNEATVEKASRERMLELVVAIDDQPVSRWGCDGVVCATPTGSTAYNFSAGGPVVWPQVEALLMVPISAHALFARPLVVSPDSVMAIEVVGAAATGVLWCDGRRAADLPPGARVVVRRGDQPVRLARLRHASFAERLVRKFDLPVAGWRGAAEQRRGGEA